MLDALTRTHLTVGRIAGVPVGLNVSWFPVFALVVWSLATGFLPQAVPGIGAAAAWSAALAGTALFFASILAHEFGHALVARRCGIEVSSVTLFILGGVSRIAEEPRTAWEELKIASAGPAVSLVVAVGFFAGNLLVLDRPVLSAVLVYLLLVNGALALFNLLPALPLDGGRMLRAILWAFTRDVSTATRWAGRGGRACGIAFVLAGVVSLAFGAIVPAGWLVLLGLFIERSAKGSVETIELDIHVPPPASSLAIHMRVGSEGLLDEGRFRRVEARLIAWRARLDVLPRPGELAAQSGEGEGPLERRYQEERQRMYELVDEIDRGVRAVMTDDAIDERFRMLSDLYEEWRPASAVERTPDAGEDAALAGRPERYAPDPEEVLSREPGSSIEV